MLDHISPFSIRFVKMFCETLLAMYRRNFSRCTIFLFASLAGIATVRAAEIRGSLPTNDDRVSLEQVITGLPRNRSYNILCTYLVSTGFLQRLIARPAGEMIASANNFGDYLKSNGITADVRDSIVIIRDPKFLDINDNALDHIAPKIKCQGTTQTIIGCLTETYRVAIGCAHGPESESLLIDRGEPTRFWEALAELSRRNRLDILAELIPEGPPIKETVTPPGVLSLKAKFSTLNLTLIR